MLHRKRQKASHRATDLPWKDCERFFLMLPSHFVWTLNKFPLSVLSVSVSVTPYNKVSGARMCNSVCCWFFVSFFFSFSKSCWCFDTARHRCLTLKRMSFSFRHANAPTFLQVAAAKGFRMCFSLTQNKWLGWSIKQQAFKPSSYKASKGLSQQLQNYCYCKPF